MANSIADRRAAVKAVLDKGEWSTHRMAELAVEWGVSPRTIDNDRRAIAGVRQGSRTTARKATLHALPKPKDTAPPVDPTPAPVGKRLSACTRAEGLSWLLDRMEDAVTHGDPGTGAYVAAAKELRSILAEREEVLERDAAKRGNITPDKLAEELTAKVTRLPAPLRRRLAEALAANG